MEERTGLSIEEASLDEYIEPIVRALNNAGYTTWNSCQGGSGHGCLVGLIEFDIQEPFTTEERKEIRQIVGQYTPIPFSIQAKRSGNRIVFARPLQEST